MTRSKNIGQENINLKQENLDLEDEVRCLRYKLSESHEEVERLLARDAAQNKLLRFRYSQAEFLRHMTACAIFSYVCGYIACRILLSYKYKI